LNSFAKHFSGMSDQKKKPEKNSVRKPGIFGLLKPYAGLVVLLIIMALLSSGVNLLIPKIIARGIDSFSSNSLNFSHLIFQFCLAASSIGNIPFYCSSECSSDLYF